MVASIGPGLKGPGLFRPAAGQSPVNGAKQQCNTRQYERANTIVTIYLLKRDAPPFTVKPLSRSHATLNGKDAVYPRIFRNRYLGPPLSLSLPLLGNWAFLVGCWVFAVHRRLGDGLFYHCLKRLDVTRIRREFLEPIEMSAGAGLLAQACAGDG